MTNPDGSTPMGTGNPAASVAGALGGLVLGPAAQLYDSHQNRKAAEENQRRTIAANKAEAELAYQRQVAFWEMQNLYNSPASQMQRFRDAGLNPHMIYGHGTPGNATSTPTYHPARAEYNVPAMQFAPAVGGILPMLMQVGSWMQSMRLSEVEIARKKTDTERMEEILRFMVLNNPELLKQSKSKSETMVYGPQLAAMQSQKAQLVINDLATRYRYEYGDDLFHENYGLFRDQKYTPVGGRKRLEFLQQEAKTRLEQARASWSEFDITNPQQVMMMVLNGVMGMAGASLRMPSRPGGIPSKTKAGVRRTGELLPSTRRLHPARRVQNGD